MRVINKMIFDDDTTPKETQTKMLNDNFLQLFQALTGRLRFGQTNVSGALFTDGEKSENMDGRFVVYTSNGSANTEDAVTHSLGSIPRGFIVLRVNKGGVVYDSGTTWTSSTIYLKNTTTSCLTTLFLIP